MSDRFFTIPPDLKRGRDIIVPMSTVPLGWHIPRERFQKIWDMGITGKNVNIGHSDTGCNEHPLLPRLTVKRNFTNSPGGVNGVRDVNGHGTHCSGTSLSRGGLGFAPEANHMFAKVLGDSGSGSSSWINAGRVWLAKEGADIISESLGGGSGGRADTDSIDAAYEAGASICCAAAGNAGYNGSNTIGYPGRYVSTACIAAYQENGKIANFSSGGREIDYAMPGQNIISTSARGGFQSMSGTSMATPGFAGIMALIIHKRRIAGFPDIKGMTEWRKFFLTEGFLQDAGAVGQDARFGYGIPMIEKILNWLQEPINI